MTRSRAQGPRTSRRSECKSSLPSSSSLSLPAPVIERARESRAKRCDEEVLRLDAERPSAGRPGARPSQAFVAAIGSQQHVIWDSESSRDERFDDANRFEKVDDGEQD